ncbi:solute carrier family 13 member 3 [Plectropomus leopardus]|uniref:solute carrier family 13 member 3 n=1 Tax=Plectropomus leopardus TaxID=160734 RepID=UPI001C4AE69F|nr:solute carrier family 13 member 3 [Plectropomus leopardus]
MKISVVFKKLWCVHKQLILLLTPLLFLPLLFTVPEKEGKCLYVVVLMAMFWCTEALPLAVTAMLPVCLFPTLGILPSKKVCPQYFLETNFLFLSGLVMASSIEEWGLHRRIALKVLTIVGVKPAWLILGMMLTSSFLSMWLSNTATTAMMLPIANAILESLFGDLQSLKEKSKFTSDPENDIINGQSTVKLQSLPSVPVEKQILSIDGGQPTLERHRTQLILIGQPEKESGLASWLGGHLQPLAEVPPAAAVMLITAFLACFTEFASNTATIIIFLPVIAELAMHVSVNPLYFMIPATVGCSYAFMLPVSTPPNSIAFASGHLLVKDMVKTGIVMNILGILSVSLAMNTWGVAMFNLNTFPEWAQTINKSAIVPDVHLSAVQVLNATL